VSSHERERVGKEKIDILVRKRMGELIHGKKNWMDAGTGEVERKTWRESREEGKGS